MATRTDRPHACLGSGVKHCWVACGCVLALELEFVLHFPEICRREHKETKQCDEVTIRNLMPKQ